MGIGSSLKNDDKDNYDIKNYIANLINISNKSKRKKFVILLLIIITIIIL